MNRLALLTLHRKDGLHYLILDIVKLLLLGFLDHSLNVEFLWHKRNHLLSHALNFLPVNALIYYLLIDCIISFHLEISVLFYLV